MPTTALWASDNVCSGGADAAGLERERRKESRKGKKKREGGKEEDHSLFSPKQTIDSVKMYSATPLFCLNPFDGFL